MDKNIEKIINDIVWWIPFKNKRNYLRNELKNEINNIINNKDEIIDEKNKIINDKYINNFKANDNTLIKKIRYDFVKDNNFIYRYNKLIKNLDNISVNIISGIISKISNFNNIDDDVYFGLDEIEYLNRENSKHCNKIIKVNNQCYIYDNKYILDRNFFEISNFYEQIGLNNIEKLDCIKNKSIIDAGAYIGDTAIILSDYTTNNVYAFEPLLVNYEIMKNIIELNNKKNIIPIYSALGEYNKDIYIDGSNNIDDSVYMLSMLNNKNISIDKYKGSNMESEIYDIYQYQDNMNKLKMVTLDKFVEENNIEVGLIKTDLEGFEKSFLKGAINTIKEQKPILIISIYHSYDDLLDIKPMIEELNLGYKFKILGTKEFKVVGETKLLAEV